MTPAVFEAARAALDALVSRAGVRPDDPGPVASAKVLAVLEDDGARGERCDPGGCPVRAWVARETGVRFASHSQDGFPRMWLTPSVLVVIAGPGPGGRRSLWLPAAVAGAVALLDGRAAPHLAGEHGEPGRAAA